MRSSRILALTLFSPLLGATLAAPAAAQTPRLLARQGQQIFGVGEITDVTGLAVNGDGDWLVKVGTPDITDVVLRNFNVTAQSGLALADPAGALIDRFVDMNINDAGNIGWILNLTNTKGGAFDNAGVYWNARRVVQKNFDTTAPEYAPGTPYKTLKALVMNNREQFILAGDVDDPDNAGSLDPMIMKITVIPTPGGIDVIEQVVVKEGDVMPSTGNRRFQKTFPNFEKFGFNDDGDLLYIADVDGTGSDQFMFLNRDLVLRQGGPSLIPGRNWKDLGDTKIGMNNSREFIFNGELDGDTSSDRIIVKNNNEIVAQEGQSFPELGRDVQDFEKARLQITEGGDVFWYADMTGDESNDNIIFRNRTPLVRENVTTYGPGLVINKIFGFRDSYLASTNGRYFVFEGTIGTGSAAAFMMDLGLAERLPECFGNEGSLRVASGLPILGQRLTFAVDNGQGIGVTPFLLVSTRPAGTCGIQVPYGEWVISLAPQHLQAILTGIPWAGTPRNFSGTIPNDPALVDQLVYLQAIFFDAGDMLPAPPFRLTNGMRVQIGLP